jgi:hypothetical protein
MVTGLIKEIVKIVENIMKNLLVLIVITLTLTSCLKRNPDGSLSLKERNYKPSSSDIGVGNPRVEVIDSCEYIIWGNKMAHKGNCKFCAARRDIVPGPPVEDYGEDEDYHSLPEQF